MLFVLIVLVSITACRTELIYVPVETIKTEYKDQMKYDSIHILDSVLIKQKNDTIWLEKYKYLYRDKMIRDSVFIRDSIHVPYPVEKIKEINKLYWYQEALIYIGIIALAYVIFFIVRIWRK